MKKYMESIDADIVTGGVKVTTVKFIPTIDDDNIKKEIIQNEMEKFNQYNYNKENNLSIFLEQNILNNEFAKFLYEVEDMEFQLIKNLVKERKKRSITQKEIAEKTGLSQQAISRIEKYGNKPTLTIYLKYMCAIGININNLFERE